MELLSINLQHFRNYQELALEFDSGINVLLGPNAQGKTNLLEAIYTLALARSHRTNVDKELIAYDQSQALISGIVHKKTGKLNLELQISQQGKKAKLNHLEQVRLSDYVGNFNVVLFAPEDLDLVKGSPSVRRHFIDMEFGQMSARYLANATAYKKALKTRNAYLKQGQFKSIDATYLDVLTTQLIEAGAAVIYDRMHFIVELQDAAQPIHSDITQAGETLTLHYQSDLDISLEMSEADLRQVLAETFVKVKDRELQQGRTLVGPQRDDLIFKVNDVDVASFGSQGQQRTTALAIKLAEITMMEKMTGEYPILLLDDVLSELDRDRQTHLLKSIQNKVQTFITTPSLSDVAKSLINTPKIFNVSQGTISQQTLEKE